jgi:hypothetical protein
MKCGAQKVYNHPGMHRAHLVVLLTVLLAGITAPLHPLEVALRADMSGGALASAPLSLDWKAQGQMAGGLSVVVMVFRQIGLGANLFLTNGWPSDVAGGYQIRGYSELGLSLFEELGFPVADLGDGGMVILGADAGVSASIGTYSSTQLSFFLPACSLTPFVSVRFPGFGDFDFRAGLPARLLLRRDMSWSGSAGISLGAAWVLGRIASMKR